MSTTRPGSSAEITGGEPRRDRAGDVRPSDDPARHRPGRLLLGAGRAAVSALAADPSGRGCAAAAAPPHRRADGAGLGTAARAVGRGRARVGWRRAAVPLRRRAARPPSGGAAAVDRRRAGRAPAHAAGGAAVPGARPHPRLGAADIRRGHRLGDAPAQFGLGGGIAHRVRLRRRGGVRLADADRARRGQLARRAGRRDMAAVAGRLVAGPGEPAAVPVPAAALVLPAVHLGAVPVAGVAHRVEAHADASGPLRRPGLPRRPSVTRSRRCCWRRERCWPG